MTMTHERARSLRFGWEFLLELQASDNLTVEQRSTVEKILRHYPTGGEIQQWVKDRVGAKQMFSPKLAPEDPNVFSSRNPAIPASIPRGPTTPKERTSALRYAYEFFRFDLMGADNLLEPQKRQSPFILRHYPEGHEVNSWAKMDAWEAAKTPALKQWLAPETES